MDWKNYRIKTEEEFIREYGEDWCHIVGWNSEGKMDYLFGKFIKDFELFFLVDNVDVLIPRRKLNKKLYGIDEYWLICKEMVKSAIKEIRKIKLNQLTHNIK